jgi:hypothetical protein
VAVLGFGLGAASLCFMRHGRHRPGAPRSARRAAWRSAQARLRGSGGQDAQRCTRCKAG